MEPNNIDDNDVNKIIKDGFIPSQRKIIYRPMDIYFTFQHKKDINDIQNYVDYKIKNIKFANTK